MTKLEAWLEKAKKAPQSDSIHNKADISVIEKLKAALDHYAGSNYVYQDAAIEALEIDPEKL